MEENNTPKPNQVMDIQPPKQPEQVPQSDAQVSQPVSVQSVEEVNAPPTEVNEVQEAPRDQDVETSNEAAVPEAPVLAAVAQPKQKHRTPILAVVCAVVVAGTFAALAVYAFLGSQEPRDTTTAPQASQQPAAASKATTDDVDSTNAAIDDSLKTIDDTADYNDNAVSDTTLGL